MNDAKKCINSLRSKTIRAAGDDYGSIDDLLIDDENWAIRYLVVDTGKSETRL